jgi:cytochrome c oxidase accessory protein FixG
MTGNVSTARVLSTLNRDGTRRWLHPKVARGRFLHRRRITGYALIALFVALPFVRIGGRPALLLDVTAPELDAFGAVFRPSDGFVLALVGITIALAVFLITALFGRVWCGWGCPQTVYLEHVFRPIERWLEGSRGQRALPWRRAAKWAIYAVLAGALGNVFLAYFVGTDTLERWVLRSPAEHPGGFGIVVAVSALVLADFAWFREQTCLVACPYGRLQSVLLDRQSLIVGYDARRGEPRTKFKKHLRIAERGDCVDCSACVAVCPTGIDIRDGLQMECIGCAQCIDACDAVMTRLGRANGLVRYSSQAELDGGVRRLVRARTIVYPTLLAVAAGVLALVLARRTGTELWVERVQGPSFVELPDGRISAQGRLKIENEGDGERRYHLSLTGSPNAELRLPQDSWLVKPHHAIEIPLFVDVPRGSLVRGERRVYVRVDESSGFERVVTVTLLGPDR